MGVLDKLVAGSSEMEGIKARKQNVDDYMKATSKEPDKPKAESPTSNADKLHPNSKYGDNPGEQRIDVSDMTKPLVQSYKKGTVHVPKTGEAILHEGEAVIPAKENPMNDTYAMVKNMGRDEKPKKEIAHIKTSKAHSGGYVHEHHHTRPEHHPMETHVTADQDAMANHMMQHLGEPNPGEADASAGAPPTAGAPPAAGM
jgi:hypothetical protein